MNKKVSMVRALMAAAAGLVLFAITAGLGEVPAQSKSLIKVGWWSEKPSPGQHEDMEVKFLPRVGDSVLDRNNKWHVVQRRIFVADGSVQLQVGPPMDNRAEVKAQADTIADEPLSGGWWSTDPNPGQHEDIVLKVVPRVGDAVLDKNNQWHVITRIIITPNGSLQLQAGPPQSGY